MGKGPAWCRAFRVSGWISSACISVCGGMRKILSGKPFPLFLIFREIDALNLKDHRACAVIAAGDHDPVIIGPSMHDGAALKCRIDIAADGIPCFPAEFSVHVI